MGGFLQGALGVIGDRAQEKVREHSANEKKLKDEQAQVYWDLIKSGRGTPEQVEYAQAQLQKIYGHSKPIKELFGKLAQVTGITHPKKEGGKDGATVAPPPGAKDSQPSPIPLSPTAPIGTPPLVQGPSPQPGTASGSATPAGPQGATPKKVSPPPSFSSIAGTAYPNPETVQKEQQDSSFNLWERQEKVKHKNKMEEEQMKAEAAAKNAGTKGIPRLLPPLSMTEAQGMADRGEVFLDAAGNPIDVHAFDNSMQLTQVVQGNKMFAVPTSQHQTHLNVGGKVYAVPALEQTNLGKEGVGTELGASKTGSTRTTIQHEYGTESSTTPITPGVNRKPSGAAPKAGTVATPSGATTATPTERPTLKNRISPPPGARQPSPSKKESALGGKVYTGAMNTQIQRAVPIREAATQVFGDPSQPQLKSLKDFAPLVDNAGSRDRLAAAFNLTFEGLESAEKHAGSLMELLKNYAGVPQMLAASRSNVMQDALGKLTPQEKDFYDSVMSTYGAVIGLRSLTKASAAQFSVKKLEQEIPIPGLNSMNSRQFYDQLSRLAEQVYNGTRTIPDAVMPDSEKKYYESQVSELIALKNKKPGQVKPPPGANKAPKTADEYLNQR